MLMWIHPLIQTVALLLAIYVLHMGMQRFRFQHLKIKCFFNWKRHVLLGKIVHGIWLFGAALGLFMANSEWGSINITGPHYTVGVLMIPVLGVALLTGLILQKPSGKRAGLAMTHGTANVLLFFMALYQFVTGLEVIQLFLMG